MGQRQAGDVDRLKRQEQLRKIRAATRGPRGAAAEEQPISPASGFTPAQLEAMKKREAAKAPPEKPAKGGMGLPQWPGMPEFEAQDADISDDMKALNRTKSKIKNWRKQRGGFNIAPWLAYVDSETGSNFAKAYKEPLSDEERELQALAMTQKLEEQEMELKDKRKQYKSYADNQKLKYKLEMMKQVGAERRKVIGEAGRAAGKAQKPPVSAGARHRTVATQIDQNLMDPDKDMKLRKMMAATHSDLQEGTPQYEETLQQLNRTITNEAYDMEIKHGKPAGWGYDYLTEQGTANPLKFRQVLDAG